MKLSHLSSNAMILAAGFGKRLQPLTLNTPKPLLTIGHETLLDYHLKNIKNAGFEKAIINTHYLASKIETHLQQHACLPYALSFEEILLDTGGGIARALSSFDKSFLSLNSDAYTSAYLPSLFETMANAFDPESMDALLLLTSTEKILGYQALGDFFHESATGKITFRGNAPRAPYVYVGIQILSLGLFNKAQGTFPIHRLWQKAGSSGRLFGVIDTSDGALWFDTGNHEGLCYARKYQASQIQYTRNK